MNMKLFVRRNSGTILTCVGAVGVVATAITTAKAAPKAKEVLAMAEAQKGEKLTRMEAIRISGPMFLPSVIIGTATIGCIFGANLLNKRQQAALVSAYALLDSSYKSYRDKVAEVYGEEAEKSIKAAVAEDLSQDREEPENENDVLFFDFISMQHFYSTLEEVMDATYRFNNNLAISKYSCVNEYLDTLGVPRVDWGYELGWNAYDFDTGEYKVDFVIEKTVHDDGLEQYIISAVNGPRADYLF